MKALILGNSQAQGAGLALVDALNAKGYNVTRLAKHGADNRDLIALYDSHSHTGPYDLSVVFSWDPTNTATLLSRLSGKVVWYGSPPATYINDLPLARKVFGSKVTDNYYWFTSGYAAEREGFNRKLKTVLPSSVRYIDYRELKLNGGTEQSSGVIFPNLNDGIHIQNSVAKQMFAAPNWPNSEEPSSIPWGIITGAALMIGSAIAVLVKRFRR